LAGACDLAFRLIFYQCCFLIKKAGGVGDGVLLNAIDEFSCLCLKHNFSWSIVHVFQGDGQRILLPLLDI